VEQHRVLVVDDEPNIVAVISMALNFQGFSVESAGDGEAVIVSATCPLRPVVVSDDDARALDAGMWRGLLAAAAGPKAAATARCSTHDCLDAQAPCRIVVAFGERR